MYITQWINLPLCGLIVIRYENIQHHKKGVRHDRLFLFNGDAGMWERLWGAGQ